jgi:hypothetical protein
MGATTPTEVNPSTLFRKEYMQGREQLPGNCMLGQLTETGRQQQLTNGANVYEAYTAAGLLPTVLTKDVEDRIFLRADDCPRTLMSGEALLEGIYPPGRRATSGPLTMNTMDLKFETIVPNTNVCPKLSDAYAANEATTSYSEWAKNVLTPLTTRLTAALGVTINPGEGGIDFVHDCVWTHVCVSPQKALHPVLTPETIMEIAVAAGYQSSRMMGYPNATTTTGKLTMGPLFAEILPQLDAVVAGKKDARLLTILSGHDTGPMLPFVVAMGAWTDDDIWPMYASLAAIELYKDDHGSFYSRFIYNGTVRPLPACGGRDLCTWEEMRKLLVSLVPSEQDCGVSEGSYQSRWGRGRVHYETMHL